MSIKIKMTTRGVPDTIKTLEGIKGRGENLKPVFWWARSELEKSNAENFTAHGLPVGGWVPRTQVYAWPIMRKTDRLFESLTNLRGAPNEVNRRNARFGTAVEYARFHQDGTRKMAKRQVVFEPPMFAQRLGAIAGGYIVRAALP